MDPAGGSGVMVVFPLSGDQLQEALPALAELRIKVFRDWPYLYEGSLEYEEKYLRKFSDAQDAVIVVAKDGNKIVGASTASPLLGHADEFAKPFAEKGYDPARVFYFGESVLLTQYRGHGIGVKFFEFREAHARQSGKYDIATFCGVVRVADHPMRPLSYVPLDGFWHKRGFAKAAGLMAHFKWKECGSVEEIDHEMQFWIKKL